MDTLHGGIQSICLSPNGRMLATGSADGTIHLWETQTGRQIARMSYPSDGILCVAFSPDGQCLASSGGDPFVHLWNAANGKEVRRLHGHRAWTTVVAFSQNGKLLACAADDNTVLLWSLPGGEDIRRLETRQHTTDRLELHQKPGRSGMAFSPDGCIIALGGSRPNGIHFWDVDTGKKLCQIRESRWFVGAVAFSPDGSTVAAPGGPEGNLSLEEPDGPSICLWSVVSGKEIRHFQRVSSHTPVGKVGLGRRIRARRIGCVAFSVDGRMLASAEQDARIYLWEVATGKQRLQMEGHGGSVNSVVFGPDGRTLVSGSSDGTALVWDLAARTKGDLPALDKVSSQDRETLWTALGNADATRAYQGIRQLVSAPAVAIPLLKAHLTPVASVSIQQLDQWVTELDSDNFTIRQRAAQELLKLEGHAEAALRKALAGQPSLQMRRSVEELLAPLTKERLHPSTERLRRLRAMEVLEAIHTPEAREVLHRLSRGAPGALLTDEARAALQRLAKRQ
jgi:WD40 repeat protein